MDACASSHSSVEEVASPTLSSNAKLPRCEEEAAKPPKSLTSQHGCKCLFSLDPSLVCKFLDIPSLLCLGCVSKGFRDFAKAAGDKRVQQLLALHKDHVEEDVKETIQNIPGWQHQLRYATTHPLKTQLLTDWSGGDFVILPNGNIALRTRDAFVVLDQSRTKNLFGCDLSLIGDGYVVKLKYSSGYLLATTLFNTEQGYGARRLHFFKCNETFDNFEFTRTHSFHQYTAEFPKYALAEDKPLLYTARKVGESLKVTEFNFQTGEVRTAVNKDEHESEIGALVIAGNFLMVVTSCAGPRSRSKSIGAYSIHRRTLRSSLFTECLPKRRNIIVACKSSHSNFIFVKQYGEGEMGYLRSEDTSKIQVDSETGCVTVSSLRSCAPMWTHRFNSFAHTPTGLLTCSSDYRFGCTNLLEQHNKTTGKRLRCFAMGRPMLSIYQFQAHSTDQTLLVLRGKEGFSLTDNLQTYTLETEHDFLGE